MSKALNDYANTVKGFGRKAVENLFNVGPPVRHYNKVMAFLHWSHGIALIISVLAGIYAMRLDPNTQKQARDRLMGFHESSGLWLTIALVFRFVVRCLFSRLPEIPQGPKWKYLIASFTAQHVVYGVVVLTALTGIALEYYRGHDITLLGNWKFHGAPMSKLRVPFAETMLWLHKVTGKVFEVMIPLHIGVAVASYFRGFSLFPRMWPWRGPGKIADLAAGSVKGRLAA